jgi:MoaA/NifB/PqqE/SkfB family radical SAM enzyme
MNASVVENKEAILRACERRSLKVDAAPFYYAFHPTMACNLRCIMCRPDGRHASDVLPFPRFADLLRQIQPVAEHVTLTGGEPLLYPWIGEVIDLLAASGVDVTITTNATMLGEALRRKLLRLPRLDLKCSIDGATRVTYRKIRGRDQFEHVLANMAAFASSARDTQHIRLILVYVVMAENLNEVLPFIDLAKTLNPYRIDFHPVRHVADWVVSNGTGWVFRASEQCCEFWRDEYSQMMNQAAAKCEREGIRCETMRL